MPVLGLGALIPDAAATISATRNALEAERYRNEREPLEGLHVKRCLLPDSCGTPIAIRAHWVTESDRGRSTIRSFRQLAHELPPVREMISNSSLFRKTRSMRPISDQAEV
jgi:hypothetical protein